MMQASIYGRLGRDAETLETKTGTPMAVASVAVNVGQRDADTTVWVKVLAFGRLAERLAGHGKGELLAASGRVEISRWTGSDGTERETWQLLADALHSTRTVRPGGKRAQTAREPATAGADPNDEIPPF
jgi:single-stranded DNA-binding protein